MNPTRDDMVTKAQMIEAIQFITQDEVERRVAGWFK
jgi:hypothetical protein